MEFLWAKMLVSGMEFYRLPGFPPATWYCDSPQWIDIAHYKPRSCGRPSKHGGFFRWCKDSQQAKPKRFISCYVYLGGNDQPCQGTFKIFTIHGFFGEIGGCPLLSMDFSGSCKGWDRDYITPKRRQGL